VSATWWQPPRGLVEVPGRRLIDELMTVLGSSATLFVIDNCEHVVAAVAVVVQQLLDACPGVHVIATSREPLGVNGETTWRAPSLRVPPLYLDRLDGRDVDDWLHGHFVVQAEMVIANVSGNYAPRSPYRARAHRPVPTVYRSFAAHVLGSAACMSQNVEWLHTARTLLPDERGHCAYTSAATDLGAYEAAFRGDHAGAAEIALATYTRGFAGRPSGTPIGAAATVALWCDDLDIPRAVDVISEGAGFGKRGLAVGKSD
jgi:hypothetical protein